jgi:hypothetical protein
MTDTEDVKSSAKSPLTFIMPPVSVLELPIALKEPKESMLVPAAVRLDDFKEAEPADKVVLTPSAKAEEEVRKKVESTVMLMTGSTAVVLDTVAKLVNTSVPAEYP